MLPPTKKARLSAPFTSDSCPKQTETETEILETGTDGATCLSGLRDEVFEWNDYTINLLCTGIARANLNIGVKDILIIINLLRLNT